MRRILIAILLAASFCAPVGAAEYIDIVRQVFSNSDFNNRVGAGAQHKAVQVTREATPDEADLALANAVLRMDETQAGNLFLRVVVFSAQEDSPSITTGQMLGATDSAILGYVSSSWQKIAAGQP